MSDVTVGPIQTYVGDSSLLSPAIEQNSVQDRVSVTLTDTNLWLVDTSKLSGQAADSQSQFTLLDLQTKYQTAVPFENINFTAITVAPGTSLSSQSSYLQTTLPNGNSLMLVQVTGGTQLGSDGISLLTTGSGGGGTSIPLGGSPDGSLTPGDGGSGGGSPNPGGDSGSPSDSSTPGQSTPGQSTPGQSTPGQSTGSPQNSTPGSPQPTPTPLNATPPPGGTPPPVPVPFEGSPEVGLLLVLVLFGYRLMRRTGKSLFQTLSRSKVIEKPIEKPIET